MTGTSVPIRVVVADDHHMTRSGVKTALSQSSGIEVVGEASDGVEALDAVSRLKPDVLVLDIEMPRMSGLELIKAMRAKPALPTQNRRMVKAAPRRADCSRA